MTCTPSTPAPARKRRRPNQDLQQRLARCEELLQEYATAKPPSASAEPSNVDELWKTQGSLIVDESGVRFMDSFLWAEVHTELRAMRDIIDNDEKDDESTSTPLDGTSPDQSTALLFSDGPDSNLEDLHPEPAHVFRLWQTFLDRVNPLTKVIHVPTVQPLVVEAATNRANLPKNVEALLFSIYAIGAVALTEQESLTLLGYPREEAFKRFSKGARVTLMRIGIFYKYDIVVLQALVLHLTSLSGRYDRHAAWILNGVIVRIAQKMGLHRDGEMLGLSPFETEMRRRIWWQIIMLDAQYALMSGLGQSLLPRSWDTKEPRNVNDADLFPTMKTVESRDGPTDMIFCLMQCEIAKLLLETPGLEGIILQNEMGVPDSPNSTDVDTARRRIDALDNNIGELLRKYGDLSMGPIHELAMQLRPMMIAKLRELICPPREQPEWGTEVKTPKDNLFKIAVVSGEHSIEVYTQAEQRGYFMWFVMTHFQVEVFCYMVGQLRTRLTGQLVERAWALTDRLFHYHTELYDLSVKSNAALAVFTLRAWRKRVEMLKSLTGSAPVTPRYITKLQSLLGSDEVLKESVDESPSVPSIDVPVRGGGSSNVDMPWDQMLGFVDASTADWDMFGNNGQIGNYMGYGTGLGTTQVNMNMNGWM